MRNSLNKFLSVGLCIVMVASGFFMVVQINTPNIIKGESSSNERQINKTYILQDPIYINGDSCDNAYKADFQSSDVTDNPEVKGVVLGAHSSADKHLIFDTNQSVKWKIISPPQDSDWWMLNQSEQNMLLHYCSNIHRNLQDEKVSLWNNAIVGESILQYDSLNNPLYWLVPIHYGNDTKLIGITPLGEFGWSLNYYGKFLPITSEKAVFLVSNFHAMKLPTKPKLIHYNNSNYWYFNELSSYNIVNVFSGEISTKSQTNCIRTSFGYEGPFGAPSATEIRPNVVPYFTQSHGPGGLNNKWCYAYSTTMVLAWWGVTPTQDSNGNGVTNYYDIAYDVAKYAQGNDPPQNIPGYIGCTAYAVGQMFENGEITVDFQTRWHGTTRSIADSSWSSNAIDDIKSNLYNGYPVTVGVEFPWTFERHMVVAIGYNDELSYVVVNDPSGAWAGWPRYDNVAMSYAEFDRDHEGGLLGFPDKDHPDEWLVHSHKRAGAVFAPGDKIYAVPVVGLSLPPSSIYDTDTIMLDASLCTTTQNTYSSGIHIRVEDGNIIDYVPIDFTGQPYDTSGNPTSLPAPVVEFQRSSMNIGTLYTASVTIKPDGVGTMYIRYRGWATDINEKVHCNYNPNQINPWQTLLHFTVVDDDRSDEGGPDTINMPRVESRISRDLDLSGIHDDRYDGAQFTQYDTYSYSVSVISSSMSITEYLDPSTCYPSDSVRVYGDATYGDGSPVSNTDVTIEITQTGASWITTTDTNGHYSNYITAPNSTGYYTVKVSISSGSLTATNSKTLTVEDPGSGSQYTLYRTTTCKEVQEDSPYDPIDETDVFKSSDIKSVTWIHLTDVKESLNVKWDWYDPNNNFYHTRTSTVPAPREWYKCWGWIWISEHLPEDMEGRWKCKIYIDEGGGYVHKATKAFTIRYEVTGRTMCKDVQGSPSYDPVDPTNAFLNTDTKAVCWIKLSRIPESVTIKWDWYDPSGSIYYTDTHITDDPAESGYDYWDWYKTFCWIWIYEHSAQYKCGQWEVKAYIQDVYGNWDIEYSEYFTITDNTPPGTPGTPTDSGLYSTSTSVTWSWTEASEDDQVSQYHLQVGTSPGSNDAYDGYIGNVLSKTVYGLSEGLTYYAKVRAMNNVGQWGGWSGNSDGITIDTQSPSTSHSLSGSYHTSGFYTSAVTVILSASDAVSGVSYTKYQIDGGLWQTYSAQFIVGGDGMHAVDYYSEDVAGNIETVKSVSIEIRSILTIQLLEGWNLISVLFEQPDTTLSVVLQSIDGRYDAVQYYDAYDSSDRWKTWSAYKSTEMNNLIQINHTMAIWIHINITDGTLFEMNGYKRTTTSIQLKTGWNFVGYPSLTNRTVSDALNDIWENISQVEGFNETNIPYYLEILSEDDMMITGCGYWICVTKDCEWIIPTDASAYTHYDPIHIYTNAGFTAGNGVTGGSGTQSDPYIIEGWDITASSAYGIKIRHTDAYFIIRNCYVHEGYYYENWGVYFNDVTNGQIENTILQWNEVGIYLYLSSNNTISNNNVLGNGDGIWLQNSKYNTIFNNLADSSGYNGIYLWSSSYNDLSNNTISNNDYGFWVVDSKNNNISTNNVSNNGGGIYLDSSSNDNNIFSNDFLNNGHGAHLSEYSHGNRVYYNNFIDNDVYQAYDYGINQWDDGYPSGGNYWSDYTGVDEKRGPNQDQPGSDGIGDTPFNIYGDNNQDRYPLMTPWSELTPHDPIHIYGNTDFTAENGVTGGNGTLFNPYRIEGWDINASSAKGIEIRNTDAYFIIRNCYVHDGKNNNQDGIYFDNVQNGRIENAISSNNMEGIYLDYSSDNIIYNNNVNSNYYCGISLYHSSNNNISNNSALNNNIGIYLGHSSYNNISNNDASNNEADGINLQYSSYNNISSNNALSNHNGIWIFTSSNNNISNNSASNEYSGIGLWDSSYNDISNNDASNNSQGISLLSWSDENNIFDNSVSNNGHGIHLEISIENNILRNNISNNDYGIYPLVSSNNNWIYHNNFIDNANQAYDECTNYWDDGYPSGGNYWSDYTGVDEKSGPNQDQPGSDGIGDTPYYIPGGGNKDNYPLMNPFEEEIG